MAKRKKYTKRLDDLKKWRIEMLAKFGGFSRKFIASQVFGLPFGAVTRSEVSSVSGHLSRHGIRLSDWRNGFSSQATSYAKDVSTPKRTKSGKIRLVAAKRRKVA